MSLLKMLQNNKERTALYASDYGQCRRKIFFSFFKEDYPPNSSPDARVARIFENGNMVHERLGAYLRMDPALEFVDEVVVPRDALCVHGRCDGIVTVAGAKLCVVEFKSINKDAVLEPKDEHRGQLMFYLHQFTVRRAFLRKKFGIDVDAPPTDEQWRTSVSVEGEKLCDITDVLDVRLLCSQGPIDGEIIYESKGTQALTCFPVQYDADVATQVVHWYIGLRLCIEARTVPSDHHLPSKFPCSWGFGDFAGKCPYFSICHGEKKHLLKDPVGNCTLTKE
jgi:hypothetical protein